MPTIRFFCVICGTTLTAPADSPKNIVECPSCSRCVPVPRPVGLTGRLTRCAPVFPPDVLELEVKFLCAFCNNRLRADARWEGRSVICPVCSEKTGVPRWSAGFRWSGVNHETDTPDVRAASTPATAPRLSEDEIAFLTDPATAIPGAVS
jgi:DNA-directed RNA polymerase subunit RPC12/RpoP